MAFSGLARIFGRRKSDCERLREMASLYLDGELSEAERQRVEFHLAQCEMCVGFSSTLRATIDMLQKLPPAGYPPGAEAHHSPDQR